MPKKRKAVHIVIYDERLIEILHTFKEIGYSYSEIATQALKHYIPKLQKKIDALKRYEKIKNEPKYIGDFR